MFVARQTKTTSLPKGEEGSSSGAAHQMEKMDLAPARINRDTRSTGLMPHANSSTKHSMIMKADVTRMWTVQKNSSSFARKPSFGQVFDSCSGCGIKGTTI